MHSRRFLVFTGCLLVSMLGMSTARAGGGGTIEGGTIRFVGAIVEPTCNLTMVMGSLTTTTPQTSSQSLPQSCSDSAVAATSASRPYSVDVTPISDSPPDRVLQYFASYVRAAAPGSANPVLVTQTYE